MTDHEKEFEKLVEEVREIDEEAAEYLENDAQRIPYFIKSGFLSTCFLWSASRQGREYWFDIAQKLGHRGWLK